MVTGPIVCNLATLSRLLVAIGTIAAFVAVVSASVGVMGSESEEAVPDDNDHLTRSELRWCLFESERIDGENEEIDALHKWEIDNYNARLQSYSYRCPNKTYYERDGIAIERELTADKRRALREQGALRVRQARAERDARRVYVKDESASIRAAPENGAAELRKVLRWGELIETGRVKGAWHEVEWQTPSPERVLAFGWVLGGFLEGGSGKEARFRYCEKHKKGRAQHNEVVRREIADRGTSYIKVENGTSRDAYMKLVRKFDNAVLSIYIAAEKTALLNDIPTGSYEIAFATGSKFSRGCDSFSWRGAAQRFAQRLDYDSSTAGWTLTLHRVSDGNARAHS